jgi:hypothetical protein
MRAAIDDSRTRGFELVLLRDPTQRAQGEGRAQPSLPAARAGRDDPRSIARAAIGLIDICLIKMPPPELAPRRSRRRVEQKQAW